MISKTLFIIPTDAHNYKIIGMLKTIKMKKENESLVCVSCDVSRLLFW